MRKIFFHLCILSFFSHTTVQSNERSKALNAIQSKIDSLNAQILSLRNNKRTSPPTKQSAEQLCKRFCAICVGHFCRNYEGPELSGRSTLRLPGVLRVCEMMSIASQSFSIFSGKIKVKIMTGLG